MPHNGLFFQPARLAGGELDREGEGHGEAGSGPSAGGSGGALLASASLKISFRKFLHGDIS